MLAGLWQVEKVMVEDQVMTPDARWTRFDSSGNYYSGNGGYQHSRGKYRIDTIHHWVEMKEYQGIEEPFGPFAFRIYGDTLVLERMEEEALVHVVMLRVKELPMANADKVIGLWGIKAMTKEGKDVSAEFLPLEMNSIFLRWDRVYQQRWPNGSIISGYYQMNAHRPVLSIVSAHEDYVQVRKWRIEFIGDSEMKLYGYDKENEGVVMHLYRLTQFP